MAATQWTSVTVCHARAVQIAPASSQRHRRKRSLTRVLLAVLATVAACNSAPLGPAPQGCPAAAAGTLGDVTARPLVVAGNRAADSLDLAALDPFAPAGCLSVDENSGFIDEPFDLAAAPTGDALYVVLGHAAAYTRGTLLRLHLPDGARLGEVTLGEEPSTMALNRDGTRAYVALFRNLAHPSGPWSAAGALVTVDTQRMQVLGAVDVCAAALGVALDEDAGRVWVTCIGDDRVAIVDVSADVPSLSSTFALDDGAGQRGVRPAYVTMSGRRAFISAQASGDVWIYDRATAAFVRRLDLGSGSFPQRLAATPDGQHVLVAVDAAEQLAAIATGPLLVSARIPLPGIHPQGAAVTADGLYAVVTDENDLTHAGRLVRVALAGLDRGEAHLDGTIAAGVFPQAVIVVP